MHLEKAAPYLKSDLQTLRGFIVIDTGTLFRLATILPASFLDTPPRKPVRLLDTLVLLAQTGFKVIVPEMVAYEAAEVLRDKKSMNMYFPNSEKKYLQQSIERFLKIPFVHIASPSDADITPAANFIRALYKIHTEEIRDRTKATAGWKAAGIVATQRTHDRKDYGDIAARELIRCMDNGEAPVFYVSDDAGALRSVARMDKPGVRALTCLNFLEALSDQHIFPMVGIREKPAWAFKETIKAFLANNIGHCIAGECLDKIGYNANRVAFSAALAGIGEGTATENISVEPPERLIHAPMQQRSVSQPEPRR